MRFADIQNIWSADLSLLSNADRGRVFYERAKQVIARALANPSELEAAVNGKRFRRSYLIERIGCQPAVTTQNPKIRQLLADTDQSLSLHPGAGDVEDEPDGNSPEGPRENGANRLRVARKKSHSPRGASSSALLNASPRPAGQAGQSTWRQANLSLGRIVSTNDDCMINGHCWPGIPTLLWTDGIDQAASDWFRDLVIDHGKAASSVHEYANILRPFLRFCRQRKRPWDTVDDNFLIIWREHLRREKNISIGRINASLTRIFAFYRWAEETGVLKFHVGIYRQDELPAARHTGFRISAKRTFVRGRRGVGYGSWATPLTLSIERQSDRVRHTPNESEIRRLHAVLAERAQGERDSLIFSWPEETGSRRAELLQVRKSQLPTLERLGELIESDEPWTIWIKRKGIKQHGGKLKRLILPPDLIIRTLDHIQFGRAAIVARCANVFPDYKEPEEIFLSSTTGLALHPDSVTAIGRRAFAKAGIQNANIHRLRARFAVRIVEALVEAIFDGTEIGATSSWVETILVKAAEMMGHSSPESLRPYLTYVLNRRIQTADRTQAERLQSRLRQLALHEETLVRRLGSHQDLQRVARDIQAGRHSDAARYLREIADQLD